MKDNNLDVFLTTVSQNEEQSIKRLYMGSSFCSQYYLNMSGYENIFKYCAKQQIHVTLTIPVFTEKDICLGKRKTEEICRKGADVIDEITVNDIGMLSFLQNRYQYHFNLGRLFFRDPRDCRIPEYTRKCVSPMLLSHLTDDYWKSFKISFVELDPTNAIIDTSCIEKTDINVGIHLPYCYMTTGNICKFASIHQEVQHKFRPNIQCKMECIHISDIYSGHVSQTNCNPILNRFGRTLYFEVGAIEFVGKKAIREIYFPVKEWREFVYGNIGSSK